MAEQEGKPKIFDPPGFTPGEMEDIRRKVALAPVERERTEAEKRQEVLAREQEPQGVCPHCKGDVYLLKIMEPFTVHTRIDPSSRAREYARLYACRGKCKTLFSELPEQPEQDGGMAD